MESNSAGNGSGAARARRWTILAGAALVVGAALAGFALLGPFDSGDAGLRLGLAPSATPTPTPTATPTSTLAATIRQPDVTPTSPDQALIERQVIAPPTHTPTPTQTAIPTVPPTPTPGPTIPAPPIEWTTEEANALAWLCYGEVGGMGWSKVDACLSVISTVRARYAYTNGFYTSSVLETITAPGQFNVRIETDQPGPSAELNEAVQLYADGVRGSCSGYLYFTGQPRSDACVIYGYGNQALYFFNSW
jgi:hypothetical protein